MVSGFQEQNNIPRKKNGGPGKGNKTAILALVFVGVLAYAYQMGTFGNKPLNIGGSSQSSNILAQNNKKGLENLSPSQGGNVQADADDIYAQTLDLQGKPGATSPAPDVSTPQTGASKVGKSVKVPIDDVDIMSSKASGKGLVKRGGKTIKISVAEGGRVNPFLPSSENMLPASLGNITLSYPPDQLAGKNSEASKVMETTISGILYDKYSPSAIVKFGGSDYLVKKGDVINKFKVIAINKDKVVVQLGKNVYRAGVGELLEQDKINYNTIANLEKKFGGNSVSINVKKKGY